jgi:simple sugar transport system substrate-binding protein
MKKRMIMLLAAMTALACTAVSAQAKTTDEYTGIEDVKIALIGSASGGNFWGNVESGFNASIEERGWEGVYWAPSGDNAGQDAGVLDLCETALTQGYNVIVPVMNDITIFEDFLSRADDAGTLVIAYNSNPGEDYVIAQVGIDSYESGWQQGEKIAQFATEAGLDEIKYISMLSVQSNTNQQLTKQGVLDAIADGFDGTVTEAGEGESHDNASTAQDAIGAMFIANSDANAIICCDQMSAVGAAAYIEENSRQGEVIACGLSLDEDALIRVKNGSLSATSSVDSVYMGGEELCEVVEAIIGGEEFEYKNFPPKIWVLPDEVDAYAEENGIDLG